MTTEVSLFVKDEYYLELVEQLKAAIVEGSFNERMARIETYHKIGEEVRAFSKHFNKNVTEVVKAISDDLSVAERSVWTALKFYDTFPDIGALPDGKAISWTKVKKLLGEADLEKKGPDMNRVALGIIKKYGVEDTKLLIRLLEGLCEPPQST